MSDVGQEGPRTVWVGGRRRGVEGRSNVWDLCRSRGVTGDEGRGRTWYEGWIFGLIRKFCINSKLVKG